MGARPAGHGCASREQAGQRRSPHGAHAWTSSSSAAELPNLPVAEDSHRRRAPPHRALMGRRESLARTARAALRRCSRSLPSRPGSSAMKAKHQSPIPALGGGVLAFAVALLAGLRCCSRLGELAEKHRGRRQRRRRADHAWAVPDRIGQAPTPPPRVQRARRLLARRRALQPRQEPGRAPEPPLPAGTAAAGQARREQCGWGRGVSGLFADPGSARGASGAGTVGGRARVGSGNESGTRARGVAGSCAG